MYIIYNIISYGEDIPFCIYKKNNKDVRYFLKKFVVYKSYSLGVAKK